MATYAEKDPPSWAAMVMSGIDNIPLVFNSIAQKNIPHGPICKGVICRRTMSEAV
jgi:hypothetical protein